MKRFFMTLAAMLLLSIGTFAQVGGPLKGDVNGDGKVDVEDVTSVVNLVLSGKTYGYFYFGTTQPTADNYQTLLGVVASYTSIGDAIGATASIDVGQILYMLCPAMWMKGKKVVVEDGTGNTYNFIEDIDAETVLGYVIYRTQAWNEATDLTLNFEITGGDEYYWYVGQTIPSSIDTENIQNAITEIGWHNMDVNANIINVGQCVVESSSPWYVCIPIINNSAFTTVLSGGVNVTAGFNVTTETIGTQSFVIFQKAETSKKFKYDFSK